MELERRLDKRDGQLERAAQQTRSFDLSSLVVGFFFKGGLSELGCEFVHKSFREYLFAERVITVLKEQGRSCRDLPNRQAYWMDFDQTDPRFQFSRELCELLGPQWLAPEVSRYIQRLVVWEISRADAEEQAKIGTPTQSLTLEGWNRVRDALADVWDWWAEGVHMRPQPTRDNKRREIHYDPAYAADLVETSAALDPPPFPALPQPKRYTTLDSHLGDGLFRLCADLHFQIAVLEGWTTTPDGDSRSPQDVWRGLSPPGRQTRRCQSRIIQEGKTWFVFSPSGNDPRYFSNYAHRVNSAGWRPHGDFPQGIDLSGIDFSGIRLGIFPSKGDLPPMIWTYANIENAFLGYCFLAEHDFKRAHGPRVRFAFSALISTDFRHAYLPGSSFFHTALSGVQFDAADLSGADFDGGDPSMAFWEGAVLTGAQFKPPLEVHAGTEAEEKSEPRKDATS
jgi:hypothetical protein